MSKTGLSGKRSRSNIMYQAYVDPTEIEAYESK